MKNQASKLELLAPARNSDIAIAAINSGADAIYMGAASHGARQAAVNSVADIARVVEHAHRFRAKVYATVNTLIYDNELQKVEKLIRELYKIGVDALIVQDMAVLRLDIPPIDLHASTQCDIRNAAKAHFLADAGFSRLVLARELTIEEIADIHKEMPDVELEAFVHGALCVSYSGDCRASLATTGRSANRGECSQVCRLPFDLRDGMGRLLLKGKHLLSLRDLNRSESLRLMADAGVSSFKIEGRLKDEAYVKNVVGRYSQILDRLVAESSGRYERQSAGRVSLGFTPSLDKAFNRGFTPYFLTRNADPGRMASVDSPKAVGQKVGIVMGCRGREITARLDIPLSNGDGIGYYDRNGIFTGFRLNRAEGGRLFAAKAMEIAPGTVLYRNRDKEFDDIVASSSTRRSISVDLSLRCIAGNNEGEDVVALDISDERGCSATVSTTVSLQEAVTSQRGPRRRILDKLGGTIYHARQISDLVDDKCFIPASVLAALRREAIAALDRTAKTTYAFSYRLPEKNTISLSGKELTVSDNVANRLAREFYEDHGAKIVETAAEVSGNIGEGALVMTTRYCLRREFGKCLKTATGKDWEGPLTLESGSTRLRIDFNCSSCLMKIHSIKTR